MSESHIKITKEQAKKNFNVSMDAKVLETTDGYFLSPLPNTFNIKQNGTEIGLVGPPSIAEEKKYKYNQEDKDEVNRRLEAEEKARQLVAEKERQEEKAKRQAAEAEEKEKLEEEAKRQSEEKAEEKTKRLAAEAEEKAKRRADEQAEEKRKFLEMSKEMSKEITVTSENVNYDDINKNIDDGIALMNNILKTSMSKTTGGTVTNGNALSSISNDANKFWFLVTRLFNLCKKIIRTPLILRLISLSEHLNKKNLNIESDMGSGSVNTYSMLIYSKLFINVSSSTLSSGINSFVNHINNNDMGDIHQVYTKIIEINNSTIRIDQLVFLLLLVSNKIVTIGFSYDYNSDFKTGKQKELLLFLNKLTSYVTTELIQNCLAKTVKIQSSGSSTDVYLYSYVYSQLNKSYETIHNQTTDILTVIKMRGEGSGDQALATINPRFKLIYPMRGAQAKSGNKLQIQYNSSTKKDINSSEIKTYNDEFLIGPVTQIFTPDQTNKDIGTSNIFNEIIKKLESGSPVCIIGYGPSGSGKTSSLIFFKSPILEVESEDGLLAMIATALGTKQYNGCVVNSYEVQSDNDIKTNHTTNSNPAEFTYKNKNWNSISNSNSNSNTKINTLNDFILNLMDDRKIEGTTNNPVSSRSHLIIKVTFTKNNNNNNATVIICDFAGVENDFKCDSDDVLQAFKDISKKDEKGQNIKVYTRIFEDIKKKKESMYKTNLSITGYPTEIIYKSGFKPSKDYQTLVNNLLKNENQTYVSTDFFEKLQEKIKFYSDTSHYDKNYDKNSYKKYISNNSKLFKNIDVIDFLKNCFTLLYSMLSIDLSNYEKDKKATMQKYLYNNNNPDDSFLNTEIIYNNHILNGSTFSVMSEDSKKHTNTMPDNTTYKLFSLSKITQISIDIETYTTIIKNITETKTSIGTTAAILFDHLIEFIMWVKHPSKQKNIIDKLAYLVVYQIRAKTVFNEEEEINKAFKDECEKRNEEGRFINKSLAQFRTFIAQMIMNNDKNRYPRFMDSCLQYQCSSNMQLCFGKNDYPLSLDQYAALNNVEDNKSVLAKTILDTLTDTEKKNLTFVIFTVINLSKKANNPPNPPYINISYLKQLYDEVTSKSIEYIDDTEKQNLINNIKDAVTELSNNDSINPRKKIEPNTIKHNILTITEIRNRIQELDQNLKSNAELLNIKVAMDQIIGIIDSFNATTTIGALEFTDTMSKFGLNKIVCRTKLTPDKKNEEIEINVKQKASKYADNQKESNENLQLVDGTSTSPNKRVTRRLGSKFGGRRVTRNNRIKYGNRRRLTRKIRGRFTRKHI